MSANRNEQPATTSSSTTSAKHIPKDAQVIIAVMNELGITEYDPRVINQLLEFVYRYTTSILDDARRYSLHAKKKNIDRDDVKLAIALHSERSFAKPPSQEVLLELSKKINSIPLPTQIHSGLRLPPERHCLLQSNFKLKQSFADVKKPEAKKRSLVPPPTSNISSKKPASVHEPKFVESCTSHTVADNNFAGSSEKQDIKSENKITDVSEDAGIIDINKVTNHS